MVMRILAIGDPHGSLDKLSKLPLKEVDLILLTGDLGSSNLARKMAFENIKRKKQGLDEIDYTPQQRKKAFIESYESALKVVRYLLRFAPVYTIYGNVESDNSETREHSREIGLKLPFLTNALNRMRDVRVIGNRIANFQGVRIGGLNYFVDTNWVRDFKPSEYREKMRDAKKATGKAKRILKWFGGLDILVCHQPPYGILDRVGKKYNPPKHWVGKHAGSKVILDYIKKFQPKYVFCGHIHEGEGHKKIGNTEVYNLGVGGYKIIEL